MERVVSSLCSCCSLVGLTLTATCLQLCCCLLVSGSAADDYTRSLSHIQYVGQVAFINLSYVDHRTGAWRTESQVGQYGSESRIDDAWGVVVHVRTLDNRTDGCRPLVNAPSNKWIALISRGACKFHQKIHNAGIVSNASAVVVYNNEEDIRLLTMAHEGITFIFGQLGLQSACWCIVSLPTNQLTNRHVTDTPTCRDYTTKSNSDGVIIHIAIQK